MHFNFKQPKPKGIINVFIRMYNVQNNLKIQVQNVECLSMRSFIESFHYIRTGFLTLMLMMVTSS